MARTAILTGDIVRSTELGGTLHKRLERAGTLAAEVVTGTTSAVDVFRGDAWQMAVQPSADALAAAIRFRIALRWLDDPPHADTRVAIGIGDVPKLPKGRISQGNGPVFQLSGRGLDEMNRGRRMTVRAEDGRLGANLDAIVDLIDTLMTQWTEAQAFAVDFALLGWTQQQAAEAWSPEPITQQTVNKHLQRAGWPAIQRALRHCTNLLS